MLSPLRDGRMTASRVAPLMTGDEEQILNLWREMVGDPAYVPGNLDGVWPVQLGIFTEELNVRWYERRTGRQISKRGETIIHPRIDWAAATLDAFDDAIPAPVECKHVGGFEKIAAILERYAPQAHWQMMITETDRCAFSIIEGAREPVIEIVEYNAEYGKELMRRALQFMECVWSLTPPVVLPAIAAPIATVKIYDMTGNNAFANEAVTWITTRQAAKDNENSAKTLKGLVPADAIKCFGHGITISRSKSGALSIKELKE